MTGNISILLVDDDELVSSCISNWLEDEGFTVHVAASGEDALLLLDRFPVDVALVDLQLKDLDGEEVILRAQARYPKTHFMMHTGKHFYKLPARLLELGMRQQDVVFKPIFQLDAFALRLRLMVTGAVPHEPN